MKYVDTDLCRDLPSSKSTPSTVHEYNGMAYSWSCTKNIYCGLYKQGRNKSIVKRDKEDIILYEIVGVTRKTSTKIHRR